jgi:hypothetical protein
VGYEIRPGYFHLSTNQSENYRSRCRSSRPLARPGAARQNDFNDNIKNIKMILNTDDASIISGLVYDYWPTNGARFHENFAKFFKKLAHKLFTWAFVRSGEQVRGKGYSPNFHRQIIDDCGVAELFTLGW